MKSLVDYLNYVKIEESILLLEEPMETVMNIARLHEPFGRQDLHFNFKFNEKNFAKFMQIFEENEGRKIHNVILSNKGSKYELFGVCPCSADYNDKKIEIIADHFIALI